MTPPSLKPLSIVSLSILISFFLPHFAFSAPQHGIAMYGDPALKSDFVALPYANPDAPKGGNIVFAESGGFDSLNPYIRKGTAPWGVRTHVVESLMGRNYDEAFSLYGLLAESIETDEDRSWVSFTLRKEARFSNGDPVTVEDVIWSFETLGTVGHPRYLNSWKKISNVEAIGERTVKISFSVADRELPLILGLRPILRKADWEGRTFEDSSLDRITGSGPYIIDTFEPGAVVTFKRNPEYWGKHLPFNKGRHNFTSIKYDYYTDQSVIFEAFKAGALSVYREGNAQRWANNFDFPAIKNGKMLKAEIAHNRPSGMTGFVMNTRRNLFQDIRVREALIKAFNFEFINQTLNGGSRPRITSYFSNSQLAMQSGPAVGIVAKYLKPFESTLPEGAISGYELPSSDGSDRNRKNLRAAKKLLKSAGWSVSEGLLKNVNGDPFVFEILLKNTATENEAIINIYIDALKRLGIQASIKLIDPVQHRERLKDYDFDMVYYRRYMSLSPGNEQILYWGSAGVNRPGTRNYMGMNSPAAESLIDEMLATKDADEFQSIVRALDRVLIAGRYVIPIWHNPVSYIAYDAALKYPDHVSIYGDWPGFLPDVWWQE